MSTTELPRSRVERPRLPKLRAAVTARPVPVDVWVVGLIVLLAAVIRVLTIDNQSLWTDEALTAYETQLPFGAMLNTVAHVETTPPLYFVLIWCWAKLFGSGEIALRSLSTILGIGLVPLAYLAGRELGSRRVGMLAAAFVTVNPLMVWYAQEARSYMLLTVLSAAGFLWFVRAKRDATRRNLAWWALFSGLALMTHFFAGFIVAPEAVWLLWVWRSRVVAATVAVVALVQVAMAPFALIDTSHGTGWIGVMSRVSRISTWALEWSIGTLYRRATLIEGLVGGAVVAVVVALLLLWAGDRQAKQGAKIAAVIAGFVFIAPLALGFVGQDYFLSRNLMPAFVPLAILVAAACLVPRARILGGTLAVGLIALFSVATARVQTHAYLQRPPWHDVARALGAASVPRAILVVNGVTADPLKVYMPHVSWVMAHSHRVMISEVDVVGLRKSISLTTGQPPAGIVPIRPVPVQHGWAVPRRVAPPGTVLLSRFRVDNWLVARYALAHPLALSINDLVLRAPKFFSRAPRVLLAFMQQPGR